MAKSNKEKNKTTRTNTTSNYSIVKATAFWGVIISGIASILTFLFSILKKLNIVPGAASSMIGIMNLIANIALFISVFLAAYAYSKGKNKTWRTLFWIFFILALLGLLGYNVLSMTM